MSCLRLLPLSAFDLVIDFIYEPDDGPRLCLLGRLAIALAEAPLLQRARGAFEDLWERRNELLLEEWNEYTGYNWSAGNSPVSPGYDPQGYYWMDGDIEPYGVQWRD